MPSLPTNLFPRKTAVPNTPERSPNTTDQQTGNCSRTCTIALATIIPVGFVALTRCIAFSVWGKPYFERRRREKEAKEAERRKLGDQESVVSSDVSSLDGEVLRMNEQRVEGGRTGEEGKKREETRRERRVEEGHEHDHVLAMITARP